MNLTAEEFYAQRDDRTTRVAGVTDYQGRTVTLSIDPQWAATYPGQVAFLTAANILARWCRRVNLVAPAVRLVPLLSTPQADLLHRALEEMRAADPFGVFVTGGQAETDYHLHLGPDGPQGEKTWHALGADWRAVVSGSPLARPSAESLNPIGAMGAACLGVAAVFRAACSMVGARIETDVLDFFSFSDSAATGVPPFPKKIELGSALMVGAGAVGGCMLYFLRMLPVGGSLEVVDHDVVKFLNLNRSTILGIDDVGQPKASVAEAYFAGHPLTVKGHAVDYRSYLEARRRAAVDLVIPVANEMGVRWDLANGTPPLMVYGSTGTDWSAHLGRHIPFREDCLSCRFSQAVEPQMACASGAIEAPEAAQPDAALPFLSSLAALLAVAELCKLQLEGYPFHGNRVAVNVAGDWVQRRTAQTEPQSGCGACRSRRIEVFRVLRGETRWAGLTLGTVAACVEDALNAPHTRR